MNSIARRIGALEKEAPPRRMVTCFLTKWDDPIPEVGEDEELMLVHWKWDEADNERFQRRMEARL